MTAAAFLIHAIFDQCCVISFHSAITSSPPFPACVSPVAAIHNGGFQQLLQHLARPTSRMHSYPIDTVFRASYLLCHARRRKLPWLAAWLPLVSLVPGFHFSFASQQKKMSLVRLLLATTTCTQAP